MSLNKLIQMQNCGFEGVNEDVEKFCVVMKSPNCLLSRFLFKKIGRK